MEIPISKIEDPTLKFEILKNQLKSLKKKNVFFQDLKFPFPRFKLEISIYYCRILEAAKIKLAFQRLLETPTSKFKNSSWKQL